MVQQEGYGENQAEPQAENQEWVLQYKNLFQAWWTFHANIFNEMHTLNQKIGDLKATLDQFAAEQEYQKKVSKHNLFSKYIHSHYDSNDDHPN